MPNAASNDPRVERSRTAVLDAAVDLLLEGGLEAVTFDAVSGRSGVARTTIYRHWPHRDDLLADVFRLLSVDLDLPGADIPPVERVRLVLRQLAAVLGAPRWQRALPALINAARYNKELASFHHHLSQHQSKVLTTVLTDAIAAGELPPDTDLSEALLQLMGPLLGAVFTRPDAIDEAFADRLVDLFFASRPVLRRPDATD